MSPLLVGNRSGPPVVRRSRRTEIPGNLRCGFPAFDQANRASNLTINHPAGPAAKVLASFSSFEYGISDAFALDLVFHMREGGHDCEQHRAHRCCCVDIASAQVQDAQAGAPAAEFVSEGKHVLSGSPESVLSRDNQGVTLQERVQRSVELGSRRTRFGDTLIDVEVIPSNAGGQSIRRLPVRGLLRVETRA